MSKFLAWISFAQQSALWLMNSRYSNSQLHFYNGRDVRQIGAYELAKAVEELGAGEILLNCIDSDGKGFDTDLIKLISCDVSIPVIASIGVGGPEHFSEVFSRTNAPTNPEALKLSV